jgi:hypothetical protein
MHAVNFTRLARPPASTSPLSSWRTITRTKHLLLSADTTVFDRFSSGRRLQDHYRHHQVLRRQDECRAFTPRIGVQTVIVVEDNAKHYHRFSPSSHGTVEAVAGSHFGRASTSRTSSSGWARPKILLATTYEEASGYYTRYRDFVLGILSDIDFPRDGVQDPRAGIRLARMVKSDQPDVPVLLLSTMADAETEARQAGCSFVIKDSPLLLNELRQFMFRFSFGDFVFRPPNGGRSAGRTTFDPRAPCGSRGEHPPSRRPVLLNWLKARTSSGSPTARPARVDIIGRGARQHRLPHSHMKYRQGHHRRRQGDVRSGPSFARIGGGLTGRHAARIRQHAS